MIKSPYNSKALILFSLILIFSFKSSQANQYAFIGVPEKISFKLNNQVATSKCGVSITSPAGEVVEQEVSAPNFQIDIDFTPTSSSKAVFKWTGKVILKGLPPALPCNGGGEFSVDVVSNSPELNSDDLEKFEEAQSKLESKSLREALEIALPIAIRGSKSAQSMSAFIFFNGGNGVRRDLVQAYNFAKVSATESNSKYILGLISLNGLGRPRNCQEGLNHLNEAAALGLPAAYGVLGDAYMYGRCVTRNFEEALKIYQKGVEKRDGASAIGVGTIYENGLGVAASLEEAKIWYQKSRDFGHFRADQLIRKIDRDLADIEARRKKSEDEAQLASIQKGIEEENKRKRNDVAAIYNDETSRAKTVESNVNQSQSVGNAKEQSRYHIRDLTGTEWRVSGASGYEIKYKFFTNGILMIELEGRSITRATWTLNDDEFKITLPNSSILNGSFHLYTAAFNKKDNQIVMHLNGSAQAVKLIPSAGNPQFTNSSPTLERQISEILLQVDVDRSSICSNSFRDIFQSLPSTDYNSIESRIKSFLAGMAIIRHRVVNVPSASRATHLPAMYKDRNKFLDEFKQDFYTDAANYYKNRILVWRYKTCASFEIFSNSYSNAVSSHGFIPAITNFNCIYMTCSGVMDIYRSILTGPTFNLDMNGLLVKFHTALTDFPMEAEIIKILSDINEISGSRMGSVNSSLEFPIAPSSTVYNNNAFVEITQKSMLKIRRALNN
jgi:hypothetical protein